MKDNEAGEISMKNPKYMAYLYFPKNFTKHFTTYIDNNKNFEPSTYASLTKYSK